MTLTPEFFDRLAFATYRAFEDEGATAHRCLAAAVQLSTALQQQGYEVQPFPCAVVAENKAMRGFDFRRTPQPPTLAESLERGRKMLKANARMLTVEANPPTPPEGLSIPADKMLGGHIALLVRVPASGEAFFFDPTAHQFTRTEDRNGYRLDVPLCVLVPASTAIWDAVKELYKQPWQEANESPRCPQLLIELMCDGSITYTFQRLETIERAATIKGTPEWINSDFNPQRYPRVLAAIAKATLEEDKTCTRLH